MKISPNAPRTPVIVYGPRHCVTWNVGRGTITETDPRWPVPLPINDATLADLGLRSAHCVYRVNLTRKRRRGKKKRKA